MRKNSNGGAPYFSPTTLRPLLTAGPLVQPTGLTW